MAFVRWSGVRPLLPALRRHRDEGRRVRLITTTYTNSTEARRSTSWRPSVSRSGSPTTRRRLGCTRRRGCSIGIAGRRRRTSDRRTSPTARRSPGWSGTCGCPVCATRMWWPRWRRSSSRTGRATTSCRTTGPSSSSGHSAAVERPSFELPPTEIHLRPFQERLLEQIEVARRHGRHRNLLVAATGTGKTVMAAVDYVRLRPTLPRARLLFVAHRQEILEQSRATFRHALRDASFGELWVGQHRPQRFEHVFASIQSLDRGRARCARPAPLRRRDRRRVPPRRRAVVPSAARARRADRAAWAHGHARSEPTASTCCATSTDGSQPSCGCGTRSTSSTSCRSPTTASTTGST